jgi:hypothetical protein
LSSGRIQAIFTSVGTPLGECRINKSIVKYCQGTEDANS